MFHSVSDVLVVQREDAESERLQVEHVIFGVFGRKSFAVVHLTLAMWRGSCSFFDVSMCSAVLKLGVGRPVRRPCFLQRSVCVFVGLHDTRLHLFHWHTVPLTAILGFGM